MKPKHPTARDFRTAANLLRHFADEAAELAAVMEASQIDALTEGNVGSSIVVTLRDKLSGWLSAARSSLVKTPAAQIYSGEAIAGVVSAAGRTKNASRTGPD